MTFTDNLCSHSNSSVLPAAVERDCLIAFSTAPSPTLTSSLPRPANPKRTVVLLRNTDPKYTPTSFNVNLSGDGSDLPMPKEHHWSSYFIAGTKVCVRFQFLVSEVPARGEKMWGRRLIRCDVNE